MEKQQYISVSEFSKLINKTPQMVYRMLKGKLQQYAVKENGKTLVSIEALGVVGDNQKTEKEPSREEILIKQLIQEKDARISDLQGQLAEANRQIAVLQQLIAAKETQKQLEAPKRHWWQRWTKNDSH